MLTNSELRRWNVGAVKIPSRHRDVAHAVLTAVDDRGFRDVIDADDDPTVPIGAKVAYSVELTEAEAQAFREASNCRYVEPDGRHRMAVVDVEPVTGVAAVGEQSIPPDSTLRWMGVSADIEAAWHGSDVAVAVLDGGTTAAVRDRFAWRLMAHRNFAGNDQNPEAVFYSYAYPGPQGLADAPMSPEAAHFSSSLQEFVLPYEAMRTSRSPEQSLLAFLQSTYEAAANLGSWDRKALERASDPST